MQQRCLADAKPRPAHELVLQLVPIDFLASPSSLVIPVPADLHKLCIETYDRCTLFGSALPSPSILLEQLPPKTIAFKPAPEPSDSLVHEESVLHVAYATSLDDRWITAAWTDNRGLHQMTASYCLGRKNKPMTTSVVDIARVIWDTTHELLSTWNVYWCVMIAKCGPMSQQEIDCWTSLGKDEAFKLVLLTVDTSPSLHLIPPAVKLPLATINFYTTPTSTPQNPILSPEQTTPLPDSTPPAGTDPEPDALLLDTTDTTHGAVLAHRLNTAPSQWDPRPALASGYLVKRGGPRLEDPPAVMEVNVVHVAASPRVYENVLRDALRFYRELGVVARVRGVVCGAGDVRPWHVAAVEKGVRALYLLM